LHPRDRFPAAVRLLATLAIVSGSVLLVSLIRVPGAGPAILAATLAITVLAAWRPPVALAILAASLPITGYISASVGVRVPWTEPLVVAALLGLSVRVALGGDVYAPTSASRRPWALLAGLILASAVVELAVEAIYLAGSPWPLLHFLRADYFTDRTSYPPVGAALLLLEGLALFAWVSNVARDEPRWHLLTGIVAASGAIAAALNLAKLMAIVRRTGLPMVEGLKQASMLRVNVLHQDVNAAASYFVLVLLLACGLAMIGRWRLVWGTVAVLIAAALWITGSRTAIGITALLAGMFLVAVVLRVPSRRVRTAAVVAALSLVAALAAVYRQYPEKFTGKPAEESLRVRHDMAIAGLRMTRAYPVFGIGIGRFYGRSREFMPAGVASEYAHENAHNNFLQVLAELGVAGLAALLWLLTTAIKPQAVDAPGTKWSTITLRIAIVGFLLTCLMGHPLLVREVAYPFWIALGLLAARTPTVHPVVSVAPKRRRLGPPVVAVLLIATIPLRIVQHSRDINLEEVASGVSAWERDSAGTWVREVSSNATFYVSGDAPLVELPLRLTAVGRETTVLILLDGRPANMIALQDAGWRSIRVVLPPEGPRKRFRRIDLTVEPPSPDLVMGRLRYAGWK
jgi:O-antigen ligase